VKRTRKKIKLTLDSVVVFTLEETLFDTKKEKMSEFLGAGMVVSDATI